MKITCRTYVEIQCLKFFIQFKIDKGIDHGVLCADIPTFVWKKEEKLKHNIWFPGRYSELEYPDNEAKLFTIAPRNSITTV
jgi:hypothetical protein